MSTPGKISINIGTFSKDTCTVESDLIANQAKFPAIRNMLEYANQRALTTLIASGKVTPYGVNNEEKKKIPMVDSKKEIGNSAYRFDIMGRIEKASEILSQVGATQADGTFYLKMKDKHLVPGMTAIFNGQRFQARVMSFPTGSDALGYTYTFKSPSGDLFSWTTNVAGQSGTKTCFGAYTSYGEKSLKGFGRDRFPDTFINHMTIQRKTVSISGSAASDVLWYSYTNDQGAMAKGWMYQKIAQAQAQFTMEDERQKWFGVSSMKNADGSLSPISKLGDDPETGLPIITGDGWEQQVAGGNVVYGSSTNGDWNLQDLTDLLTTLKLNSDQITGQNFVGVTGTYGFNVLQSVAATLAGNQNTTFFQVVNKDGSAGGPIVDAGFVFWKLNINGMSIMFVQHPLFDDTLLWTENDSDGHPLMSSTVFVMNVGTDMNKNMEILCKGANGINRDTVIGKFNGMTGASETATSEEDAMKWAILKENMINVYNTQACGILRKSA